MAFTRNPHHEETPLADRIQHGLEEIFTWMVKYRILLISLVAALLIAGIVLAVLNKREQTQLGEVNRKIYEINLTAEKEKKDPAEAVKAYRQLLDEYKSGKPQELVHLALVQSALQSDNPAVYLDVIRQELGTLPPVAQPLVKLSEAQILWGQQKNDEALQILQGFEGDDPIVGKYPLLLKAQILESMGKKEEALTLYQGLAQEEGIDPYLQQKAQSRLVLLKVQG